MRLNRENRGQGRAASAAPTLARVENILRLAADFDPGIEPGEDFVRAALMPRTVRARRRRPARPLVLGFSSLASGVAAAALLLFVLSHNETTRQTIAMDESGPAVDLSGDGKGKPVDSAAPPVGSGDTVDVKRKTATPGPPTRNQENGDEEDEADSRPARRHSRIQAASLEESRPVEPRDTIKRIPKVRWKDEVVQRYDRGVYAPAYMVEERDRNGDVVYQPVMMPVTTETGARPLLLDGAPDTTIQWTNQSEESSHK